MILGTGWARSVEWPALPASLTSWPCAVGVGGAELHGGDSPMGWPGCVRVFRSGCLVFQCESSGCGQQGSFPMVWEKPPTPPLPEAGIMPTCGSCSKHVPEGKKFCLSCGKPVAAAAPGEFHTLNSSSKLLLQGSTGCSSASSTPTPMCPPPPALRNKPGFPHTAPATPAPVADSDSCWKCKSSLGGKRFW